MDEPPPPPHDPIRQLCLRAHPGYRGDNIRLIACTDGLPVDTTYPGYCWVAVNLATGKLGVVPRWTKVTTPPVDPTVAFVLWPQPEHVTDRDHGLRVFVHPTTIAPNLLTEQATLTVVDRTTLWVCRNIVAKGRRSTAEILGVDPADYQAARIRLVEHGFMFRNGRTTTQGRARLTLYWDSSCLPWA